jgi:hypothetical protein
MFGELVPFPLSNLVMLQAGRMWKRALVLASNCWVEFNAQYYFLEAALASLLLS